MADELPPILMNRRYGALVPCSEIDGERLREIPTADTVEVKWKRAARSSRQLRLYWALVRVVRENMENPPPKEIFHQAVKVRLGYAIPIKYKDGTEVVVPGSIAIDKMDHAEFTEFMRRFKAFLSESVIPGLNSDAAEIEARTILGELPDRRKSAA